VRGVSGIVDASKIGAQYQKRGVCMAAAEAEEGVSLCTVENPIETITPCPGAGRVLTRVGRISRVSRVGLVGLQRVSRVSRVSGISRLSRVSRVGRISRVIKVSRISRVLRV
jgi:hypothetical protein